MTRALARGGPQHFGWGQDRYLLADIFDAINQNTRACGNWGKKAPDVDPYPTPANTKPKATDGKKRTTVKDLYNGFMRRKNKG